MSDNLTNPVGYDRWRAERKKHKRIIVVISLSLIAFGIYDFVQSKFIFSISNVVSSIIGLILLKSMTTVKFDVNAFKEKLSQDEEKLRANEEKLRAKNLQAKIDLGKAEKKRKKSYVEEKMKSNSNKVDGLKQIEINSSNREVLNMKLKKIDNLSSQFKEIQRIVIPDVSDFRVLIQENEKQILERGNEEQLFLFLKVDSFLNSYYQQLILDRDDLKNYFDLSELKYEVESEFERQDLDKIIENFRDAAAKLQGQATFGFDAKLEQLLSLGEMVKPNFESQVQTIDFYRSIAKAMILFYLSGNRILYFQIFEGFEKLGVFDSSWQRDVLKKLDRIEIRLGQLNNQLVELNSSFIRLCESSDVIVTELKKIDSNISTTNMLQTITAFQTWRINQNTKRFRTI